VEVPFRAVLAIAVVASVLTACTDRAPHDTPPTPATAAPSPGATPSEAPSSNAPSPSPKRGRQVLLIVEENSAYGQIIGDSHAPYLNGLARVYGTATRLDAGYPAGCPSLAAYLLLTSGATHGICDDGAPQAHPLSGASVFSQVKAAGLQWRAYAESAPGPCALGNSRDGRYLVRHVPATYYVNVRADCRRWALPLGTSRAGALHDDVAAGALPAFGFITPNACNDMHGAPVCSANLVADGDRWLRTWIPQILTGPDYRSGRLTVIITWDEGDNSDNHIPTLIISPTTRHITSAKRYTHCSTLRTVETLLRLPLLGCATTAPSMVAPFAL
jgi:hypothetical protein